MNFVRVVITFFFFIYIFILLQTNDADTGLAGKVWYCWETKTISEYMRLLKYLNLDQETGKITTKSAVEKNNDPIISFNDVWVIVSRNNFFLI